jgi:hypothetical protein
MSRQMDFQTSELRRLLDLRLLAKEFYPIQEADKSSGVALMTPQSFNPHHCEYVFKNFD